MTNSVRNHQAAAAPGENHDATTPDRDRHNAAIPSRGRPAPHIPPWREPAHRIATDAEAIEIARDRERRLPIAEIERFSQSGLWGISVPKAYGGAGVSSVTLAEVTAIISAADASIGQIQQNHFYMVEALRLADTEEQKRHYFERVLNARQRFGSCSRSVPISHDGEYTKEKPPSFRPAARKADATTANRTPW